MSYDDISQSPSDRLAYGHEETHEHKSHPRRGAPCDRVAASARRTNVRYWILAMIFIVTTVNYADRATLSITGPAMREAFGFSAVQMGYIFSAFSWAYVMAQIPGGWLLDAARAASMRPASVCGRCSRCCRHGWARSPRWAR